jgi:hypothetical protein
VASFTAPPVQLTLKIAVLVSPQPIPNWVAPSFVLSLFDTDVQNFPTVLKSLAPYQASGAASKNLPLPLTVDGVMKTIPPPGPRSPIAQVPPIAHDAPDLVWVIVTEDAVAVSVFFNPENETEGVKLAVAPV